MYSEDDFERKFRIPRLLFARLEQELLGKGEFKERSDATGRPGIHQKIKLIAALRDMEYGMAYDQVYELCELSESLTRNAFLSFIEEVTSALGAEYLRRQTENDLRRILSINQTFGFPGCIGSWDCQHWAWKNRPVAWEGQFKGKEKNLTVVLEAICDGVLWIWGCNFGSPGSMNDIKILDSSSIFKDIPDETMLHEFEYTVNGRMRRLCYYCVDGFIPNITSSSTTSRRLCPR